MADVDHLISQALVLTGGIDVLVNNSGMTSRQASKTESPDMFAADHPLRGTVTSNVAATCKQALMNSGCDGILCYQLLAMMLPLSS